MVVQYAFGVFAGQDCAALHSDVPPSQLNARCSAQGGVGQEGADCRTLMFSGWAGRRDGAPVIPRPGERDDLITRGKTLVFGGHSGSLHPPLPRRNPVHQQTPLGVERRLARVYRDNSAFSGHPDAVLGGDRHDVVGRGPGGSAGTVEVAEHLHGLDARR